MRPRTGDMKVCEACSVEFYRRPYEIRTHRKYCSIQCAGQGNKNSASRICEVCGTRFERPRSQERHRGKGRFCSKTCKGQSMRLSQQGPGNPYWKGGVSKENHRLRTSIAFREWREAVFERDDYTCQFCGKRGGYLEPDHIKPFAYYPDLRFDVGNGRTLCQPCHRTTDTYGHKATKWAQSR